MSPDTPVRKWHPSHQSEGYHKAILELYTPSKPRTCQKCGWKGSLENLCTVCLDMIKTLLERPTHYWLDLEAQERIQERLRRQALDGDCFDSL